eukprot:1008976-Rhodomonas_salina.3
MQGNRARFVPALKQIPQVGLDQTLCGWQGLVEGVVEKGVRDETSPTVIIPLPRVDGLRGRVNLLIKQELSFLTAVTGPEERIWDTPAVAQLHFRARRRWSEHGVRPAGGQMSSKWREVDQGRCPGLAPHHVRVDAGALESAHGRCDGWDLLSCCRRLNCRCGDTVQ